MKGDGSTVVDASARVIGDVAQAKLGACAVK